jgi:hypothetical protein
VSDKPPFLGSREYKRLTVVAHSSFPLFVEPMFKNLGVNWALTLVAFLALACAPMPM